MRPLLFVSFVVMTAGCESGLARTAQVTLPPGVATSFSATGPGLLVSDLTGEPRPYLALCGQTPKSPVALSYDLGFGCLGDRAGTTETARAWAQPLPRGWDAAAICAQAPPERPSYRPLALAPTDGGVDAGVLPTDPEVTWPQGSDEGTWRRDLSPCGGLVSFELVLAVP